MLVKVHVHFGTLVDQLYVELEAFYAVHERWHTHSVEIVLHVLAGDFWLGDRDVEEVPEEVGLVRCTDQVLELG